MKYVSRPLLSLSISLLFACGGGGGGSAGGTQSRPTTGLRVVHAAIDTPPLSISLSGSDTVLARAQFGGEAPYVSMRAESFSVSLFEAGFMDTAIATADGTIARGDVPTLLIFGESQVTGRKTSLIDGSLPALAAGESAARIIHATVRARDISGSIAGIPFASSVEFGKASEYVVFPSGEQTVAAARRVDGKSLLSGTRSFEARTAYTIVLAGQIDFFTTAPVYRDN